MDTEIWSEKHRPKTFDEVKGQDRIVERIKAFVKQKNIPHLLFSGPAGTGKSTLALIISRQLFKENWRQNFLETNASEERGIQIIREKIKNYARTKAIGTDLPKIIFLDECDALTREAQQALRRMMEQYTTTTRFCLSCNYSSKIIDPIQSRCAIFRFKPLEKEDILALVNNLAKKEKIKVDNKSIEALYKISNGDARRVINILQSCASISNKIDEKLIYEIVSAAKPKEVKEVLELAIKGQFIKSKELLLEIMLKHGLSGLDVVKQIQQEVWDLKIKDEDKLKLVEKCGEIEFRMVEGSDEFVQLTALLSGFVGK